MNEALENIIPWIELLENTVYNNRTDFEKTFCYGNELVNLRFSSELIEFTFLAESGSMVIDSCTIEQFNEWLDN